MNILSTSAPTALQLEALDALAQACCIHDNLRLSYPTDESGEHCCHYLLYEADGTLAAALAMMFLDDGYAACSAFTDPAFRRRGYFSRLLHTALDAGADGDEYDIVFAISGSCPDTMAVLEALGAELESREHQMELVLAPPTDASPIHAGLSLTECRQTAPSDPTVQTDCESEWTLLEHGAPVGQCLITPVSASCVCLHHVEIAASYRRKGYGTRFMALLLPRLAQAGIRKILLQVSGDNPAALALYKKTGFRLTETLSFYSY